MARNRMISKEAAEDLKIGKLSDSAKWLFIQLWILADDEGFLQNQPDWIRIKVWPYEPDKIVDNFLKEIFDLKMLEEKNGIIKIKNFLKYQRIDKPQKSKLKAVFYNHSENGREESANGREESSRKEVKEKLKEVKEKEKKGKENGGALPAHPASFKFFERQNGELPNSQTTLKRIFENLEVTDDAKTAQFEVVKYLENLGFTCETEIEVDDRGDGHSGRIDIVSKIDDYSLAIEVDYASAREKSLFKLKNFESDKKVILLRKGEYDFIEDIEIIPLKLKTIQNCEDSAEIKNNPEEDKQPTDEPIPEGFKPLSDYLVRQGYDRSKAELVANLVQSVSGFVLGKDHVDIFKTNTEDEIKLTFDVLTHGLAAAKGKKITTGQEAGFHTFSKKT